MGRSFPPFVRALRRPAALGALATTSCALIYAVARGEAPAVAQAPAPAPAVAPTAALELLPEDLATAELRGLTDSVPLRGTLEPRVHAAVGAPRAGRLEAVCVRPGDAVKRGQRLARLDDREGALQLRELEAQRDSAAAERELARAKWERARRLAEQQLVAPAALDELRAALRVQQARVHALEAQLGRARLAAESDVVSPIDGVISERRAEPGALVSAGQELLHVVNLATLELVAPVAPEEATAAHLGQPVRLTAQGLGERELRGRVERISPATEPGSRSIALYVSLADPQGELRAGLFAQGQLELTAAEQALTIPQAALREASGEVFALALEDGRLVRRPLQTGRRDPLDGAVEILSGLAPGEHVLLGSDAEVPPGTPVHIAAAVPSPTDPRAAGAN